MNIIISILKPLVKNGIISQDDLERIEQLSDLEYNPESKLDRYKTIKETSQILRVDRKTVYNWMKCGKLQYSRLCAKKVLIYESSIIKLIKDYKNK